MPAMSDLAIMERSMKTSNIFWPRLKTGFLKTDIIFFVIQGIIELKAASSHDSQKQPPITDC
eukprot:m.82408 g.82408  ORF g.82408 m.82408 type:complete len:62 (-) comp12870_c0_seq1:279-464(-)